MLQAAQSRGGPQQLRQQSEGALLRRRPCRRAAGAASSRTRQSRQPVPRLRPLA